MTTFDPHSEEHLLADRDFVRDIAARLTRDGDDADDVAQDVVALASTRAPPETSARRAWLAKMARARSIDVLRRRMHRAQREQRASRGETVASAGDVVARESARKAVVQALMRLPPAQREVLLLRYYDALPPRVIAKRIGVPIETARTRIKRALASLRRQLARGRGGREGLLALAPLLVAPALSERAARWIAPRIWWRRARFAALSTPAWLGAAAALLAVLPFAAWIARSTPELGDAVAVADRAADGAREQPQAVAAIEQPISREQRAAATASPLVLRALVVRGDGDEPVRGVRAAIGSSEGSLHVRTDDGGRFAIAMPQAGEVRIAFEATARTAAHEESIRVDGASSERELCVRLPAATAIRGVVVGADGWPQPFAEVLCWSATHVLARDGIVPATDRRATCDALGRFELLGVRGPIVATARHRERFAAECLFAREREYELDHAYEDARFELADPRVFEGAVVDGEGRGVEGARLHVFNPDIRVAFRPGTRAGFFWGPRLHAESFTTASGGFVLDAWVSGAVQVGVERAGYRKAKRAEPDVGGRWTFALEPAAAPRVALVDLEREPVTDARLERLSPLGGRTPVPLDARGIATLPSSSATEILGLVAERENGDAAWFGPVAMATLARSSLTTLVLAPARDLHGTVVDARGEPVADARVELTADAPGAARDVTAPVALTALTRRRASATTDAHGAFSLRAPVCANEVLAVTPPRAQNPSVYVPVEAGRDRIDVRLEHAPPQRLRALVRDRSGAPVTDYVLSANLRGPGIASRRLTEHVRSIEGTCELALPVRGAWRISVTSDEYAPAIAASALDETVDDARVELRLHPKRDVVLQSIDRTGRAVPGAIALVERTDASDDAILDGQSLQTNRITFDERGEVTLFGVPEVPLLVRVFAPPVHRAHEFELDATTRERVLVLAGDFSSSRESQRIELREAGVDGKPWSGRFALEVLDASGRVAASFEGRLDGSELRIDPLARYSVVALDADGSWLATDRDAELAWSALCPRATARDLGPGEFDVDLPLEACTLAVRAEGRAAVELSLTPASRRESVVRVKLPPAN